jgi:hypothetical protein
MWVWELSIQKYNGTEWLPMILCTETSDENAMCNIVWEHWGEIEKISINSLHWDEELDYENQELFY